MNKSLIGIVVGWSLIVIAVLGFRAQWLALTPMLGLLVLGGLTAAIAGGVAIGQKRRLGVLFLAAGLLPMVLMVASLGRGLGSPMIHDVSTLPGKIDFVFAPQLRNEGDNKLDQPPADVVTLQQEAYADLHTLVLLVPLESAYKQAVRVAQESGWQVTYERPNARFEAISRTRLFGFTDDIAVVFVPTEGGVNIDVRSVSRAGVGDFGVNAQRIRDFLQRLARYDLEH